MNPTFSVIKVTDRVQPKPGPALPKTKKEGGEDGREKTLMIEAKGKIAIYPRPYDITEKSYSEGGEGIAQW